MKSTRPALDDRKTRPERDMHQDGAFPVKIALLFITLAIMACGKHHDESVPPWGRQQARAPADSAPPEHPDAWREELAGLDSVPVQSGDSIFYVLARRPSLAHRECASCHTPELKITSSTPASERRAHWNILLAHADTKTMTCATCHEPGAPDRLRTVGGTNADIDRSFEICGSCHFRERRDWATGAHGKRVRTWQGPRLIESCASCHDSHKPAIASRFPVAHPTIDPKVTR